MFLSLRMDFKPVPGLLVIHSTVCKIILESEKVSDHSKTGQTVSLNPAQRQSSRCIKKSQRTERCHQRIHRQFLPQSAYKCRNQPISIRLKEPLASCKAWWWECSGLGLLCCLRVWPTCHQSSFKEFNIIHREVQTEP